MLCVSVCGYVSLKLNSPFCPTFSEDEFGPPRVPSGYRSQSPRGYRDNYDDDNYNSPAADNRYAPSRTPQQQQRGRYNDDEYELSQTNGGASNTAAGDIRTMPGYLAEVRSSSHLCSAECIMNRIS